MGMEESADGVMELGMNDEVMLSIASSWIVRALSSVKQSDPGHYRKLLTDLRDVRLENPTSVSALQLRLRALSENVSFISERDHRALLDHVLGLSIWIFGGGVADALLGFVVNLATANGGCVMQCLDMLVRNFLPPSCGLPSFFDTYSKNGLMGGWLSMEKIRAQQSDQMARKEEVLDRLHAAIQQIFSLVPTAVLRMQPIILQRIPHRSALKEWNGLYLETMLRLENSGAQYIGSQMLPAVVDHLIQIDVEIRWEDILTEEETGKVYMFHMDLEEGNEEKDADESKDGDPAGPGIQAKIEHGLMGRSSKHQVPTLDEMADKMDFMMDMTFQHLQACAERGQSLQVYDTLVKSFQSTILDTHKSKFTQFLIFYLCSLAPDTCGSRFASLLCDIFTSRTRPPNTRMSAAAYLASYLARAKFLSIDVIFTSLKRMVNWCVAYGDEGVKSMSSVPDAIFHGVFFSACQAVMYTLCFRFRMLVDDSEGKRFLRGLPLQRLVEHRLNPLKVCLPSVVEEFLKQASMFQLVDQKHWLVSKEWLDAKSGVMIGHGRLDMFFPFDPYLLRRSDRFIRPNFTYWSMIDQPRDENGFSDTDENGLSDTEDNNDDDAESDVSSHPESLAHEFAQSFDSDGLGNSVEDLVPCRQNNHENLATMRLGEHLEAASPYSEDGCFQDSFEAMAITPPGSLKMPAKLPSKLPATLPYRTSHFYL